MTARMLIAAAIVLFVLGLLHSILGEIMIFRRLPQAQGLPTLAFPPLVGGAESAQRTLRACWHVLTLLGWTLAALLGHLAAAPALNSGDRLAQRGIAMALGLCAVVMLLGTRAKHLGWVGFLVAGTLTWSGCVTPSASATPPSAGKQVESRRFVLAPGTFAELNLAVPAGARVVVDYAATGGALDWDIHSHPSKEQVVVHQQGKGAGDTLTFAATVAGGYSFLWKNTHNNAVKLTVHLTRLDGATVRSWHPAHE